MHRDHTRPSLLRRLRDPSDQSAWVDFDDLYRDLIVGYLRRRGVQATDADDILQMVMLRMSRSLAHFEYDPQAGRFRDYLRRTVENTLRSQRRKRRPAELHTEVARNLAADPDDDLWNDEWRAFHYQRAMLTMRREHDRRTLETFDLLVAGKPVAEVAEAMALSKDAVYKIQQRVRRRVQELVATQIERENEGWR